MAAIPTKHLSPIAATRAEALRARITHQGSICLDADAYRNLRIEGFSHTDVDRVIDTMVAAGEITIDTTHGSVEVRIAEQAGRRGDE